MLYADFLVEHGTRLFEAVVARDLEGVAAKHKDGLYTPEATTWVKVKNPHYSPGEGWRKLFIRRKGDPFTSWRSISARSCRIQIVRLRGTAT